MALGIAAQLRTAHDATVRMHHRCVRWRATLPRGEGHAPASQWHAGGCVRCGIRQASVALFATSVLVICLLALSLRNTVRMSARGLPLCALFGVAGILGGGKVTNVYADLSYAQFRDVVFGGYASMGDVVPASGMGDVRTAMLVAIVTCLTLLMLLTVWAGVRLLADVRNERNAAALLASHNADRSRLESYLAGRGLNSVQVEVVLRIVAGESGPQIARAMCYSIGAVNSARDAAYRLLRVHRAPSLLLCCEGMRGFKALNNVLLECFHAVCARHQAHTRIHIL